MKGSGSTADKPFQVNTVETQSQVIPVFNSPLLT